MKISKIKYLLFITIFSLITILSCQKESDDLDQIKVELRGGGSDGDPLVDDCLRHIPQEFRNVNFSYSIRMHYERAIFNNPSLIKDGSPIFSATTYVNDGEQNYGITPMRSKSSDSITSLLLTESDKSGFRSKVLQSCKVDSLDNTDSLALTRDDIKQLFNFYQCIIDCKKQGGELELRGGGDGCFDFGDSWWEKLGNRLRKFFRKLKRGNGSSTNSNGDNNDHDIKDNGSGGSNDPDPSTGGSGSNTDTERKKWESTSYYLENILNKCNDIITHVEANLPLDYEDGKVCTTNDAVQTSGGISNNQFEYTYLWDYYQRCKLIDIIEDCGILINYNPSSPLLYFANLDRLNGNDLNLTFISKYCGHILMEDAMEEYISENNTNTSFKTFFERYIWINAPENAEIKQHIETFLLNHPTTDAEEYADQQIDKMRFDPEYKALVVSSFGWSPIMWTIAKEIIGDKAIDLFAGVAGVGNVKDALKAAKNADWIELAYEVAQILGKNTPIGKAFLALEATSELITFCQKVGKLMDRLSVWSSAKIEQVWNIVQRAPKALMVSGDYWKYVDDIATAKFGAAFANFSNYNEKFREKWGIPTGEIWVHHAVEKQALTNWYPNLGLTEAELNSLENLRGIPVSINNQVHLSDIRIKWNNFYNNNNPATMTKQKLLDFAKTIDDEFGHLFNPPIR